MAGSDVQITLGADASAAVQGLAQFNASLGGLAPQVANLASAFAGLAGKIDSLTTSVGGLANGLKTAGAQGADGVASLQKQGGGAASSIASLTGNVTTLAKSAGDLGHGLKSVGVEGTEALVAVGDIAAPVAAGIGAVVQIGLSAADAMAEWARETATSASASDDARQKAQALNAALGQAQTVFKSAGDVAATSLAPAFTVVVGEATHLAQGFVGAADKGGLLKSSLDILVGGINATLVPILSLAEAVELTWIRISGSWDEMGDKWRLVQDLFSVGVTGIKAAFVSLAVAIADALTGNWAGAAQNAVAGVGEAAQAAARQTAVIRQDMAAIGNDESAVVQRMRASASRYAEQIRQLHGLPNAAPNGAAPEVNGGSANSPASNPQPPSTPGAAQKTGSGEACECDAGAAEACEAALQTQRTALAAQGEAQRASDHAQANAQTATNDAGATAAFASNQTQQVAAAQSADRAKADSSEAANRKIAEANDKTLKQFQSSMNHLVNTFAGGLAKMVEGSKSFGQVLREIGQQILDDIFRVVVGMVEKWAWGETEKVLATAQGQALLNALGLRELATEIAHQQAQYAAVATSQKAQNAVKQIGATQGIAISGQTALKDIANSAAQAAGAAYRSLAGVPFVGPILGAAAAATVFAAVLAFKGLVASAAGGYDIPAGLNPLTQLHAQEMVLPARLANPMRDMLASYGSSGAPAAGGGGHSFSFGDTHIHGAPNMSPSDFKQALAEHRANVAGAVADALRSGWRPNYRQPVGAL